ncbi:MAG: hypothetical protein J0H74_23660 [Chitinophagaceae bacterium]|nr:hypothetical protein [Chitinophagaceae bacterium]
MPALTRLLTLQAVLFYLFILPLSAQQLPKFQESNFFLYKQDNGAYAAESNKSLGLLDFALHPHLDHE